MIQIKKYEEVDNERSPTPFYEASFSPLHGFLEILHACIQMMHHSGFLF